MTLREPARRVQRDVKAVHGDVHALLKAGVLDRTDDGKIAFARREPRRLHHHQSCVKSRFAGGQPSQTAACGSNLTWSEEQ